ncbi:hypothetical protein PC129_g18752 [Phytophthora cactorum]|uniref:Uncharacterized protein n=1 Tax=Phytophthora cactorum TaxID=29920 RepID=A0A329SH43_9STRA|nr:hypothetical protein Pcac1_g22284 [Phytophthora cactorum]KAG2803481.1 hypothetical protein PC112_g19152 [Phytophthora cactorum]KAG2882933.1 hypothetical protein PC114_g20791 [Phytophthora cactorum]KAG2892096.1 hypothetical protein PC115_g18980 [Phytophthora cactorum]KAG3003239.1 hypothetical protein PC120_g19229 [Phytophthora cactorum]
MSYFALFYSYQIMCYYIYWNMGIVMTVVALGATTANI